MKRTVPTIVAMSLVLTACGSRQGVPSTATKTPQVFSLGSAERPTKIAVKEGETVYALAYRYGITSRNLIAANGLQPPYTLLAGQELDLPSPQEHVVIEGEDIEGIAAFYGVEVVVLARENRLSDNSPIKSGDRLVIPTRDTVARDESASPIRSSVVATSSLAPLAMDDSSQGQGSGVLANNSGFDFSSEIVKEKLGSIDIQSELRNEMAQEGSAATGTQVSEVSRSTPAAVSVSHTPLPQEKPQQHSDDDASSVIPVPPLKATAATAAGVAKVASTASSSTSSKVPTPRAKPNAPAAAPVQALAPVPTSEYTWPARGKVVSYFGDTLNGANNDGINIAVPDGSPVKSAAGGEVVYSGNALKGFGNLVLVKHSNGYMTAYGHNSKLLVKKGEVVQQGQKIAEVGSTGGVNSPQLHFELRKGTEPIDPIPQLGS